jgi:5-hydroxyisourate hydrolase-like protein (transthyretin family)
LAKFSDENGINVSQNGLGHNIVAMLKNITSEEVQEIILNDFYTTDLDTFTSGKAIYPLSNLEEGKYTLEVKAWDTHNNAGMAHIEFTVVSGTTLQISEFINYPNPIAEQTTFRIAHNRAGDDLQVNISIYNTQGEMIQTLHADFMNSDARLDGMVWYGTNTSGHRLRPGIYIAKVLVKSLQDRAKNEKYRKLIIIN